jgi:hypothetical protein
MTKDNTVIYEKPCMRHPEYKEMQFICAQCTGKVLGFPITMSALMAMKHKRANKDHEVKPL